MQHAQLPDIDIGKQFVVFKRTAELASLRFEDALRQTTAQRWLRLRAQASG